MYSEKQFKKRLEQLGYKCLAGTNQCSIRLKLFQGDCSKCDSYKGCCKLRDFCNANMEVWFRGKTEDWLEDRIKEILETSWL